MITLQADMAEEAIKNSFNTNPDNVFGVLVGILLLGLVGYTYGLWKLIKHHKDEMAELRDAHKEEMKDIYEKPLQTKNDVEFKLKTCFI